MSKLQIRKPLLITAALALAPAVALAAGDSNPSKTTTTTRTTTVAPSNGNTPAPPSGTTSASGTLDNPSGSAVLSPTTPPDMRATDEARLERSGNPDQASIDPAQVQKVFGMDVALIDLKALNKDQVKQLQQRLQERGLYRGKIDGALGPQTRNALTGLMAQQYSLNQRLMNQGQITEQFASSIGVDTHGRAPVTGVDLNSGGNNQPTQPAPRTSPPPNGAPSTTPAHPAPVSPSAPPPPNQ
ncbi:MAG TPA: peptidoglycan-binding domain-containing protein [Polyangiaceae bacterium]|nr:peptidoglycan-binding domain-containing protein [Polyangiaceae bacterium]